MARRKARRREIEPLGAVLGRDHTFRKLVDTQGSPIGPRDWETAVGSRIAARARPYRLEGGVLSIVAATAAWSQELSLLSDRIIIQLARFGIEVSSLRFKVGKIEAPERPARRPPKAAPPLALLPNTLAAEIAKVDDPELRQAIARAARRALGFTGR
jgi:predicted nucleic acid-binding Zn ribbon protein